MTRLMILVLGLSAACGSPPTSNDTTLATGPVRPLKRVVVAWATKTNTQGTATYLTTTDENGRTQSHLIGTYASCTPSPAGGLSHSIAALQCAQAQTGSNHVQLHAVRAGAELVAMEVPVGASGIDPLAGRRLHAIAIPLDAKVEAAAP